MLRTENARGAFTALVTPFVADGGEIDWAAFEALVEAQIAGGIDGLVPCGTTGESATLTDAEAIELVRRAAKIARGRVPVIAGTGSFSTKKTIAASRAALDAGADGVMVVVPYYNKPTQEGLVEHAVEVAAAVDAPVVLYNIPGRTGVDLGAEATVQICARAPNVIALKDATGNVLRCQELVRRLGERLAILCGDDTLTLPMMSVGARGVISVSSNAWPARVSEIPGLVARGEWAAARAKHLAMVPVHEAMFLESNPAPVKWVLASRGAMSPAVRSPLVPATAPVRARLDELVRAFEAS